MAELKEPAERAERSRELSDYKEVFEEQREDLIRHLQQFIKSPLFIDLRDSPVQVSDSPETIEDRKRDLDYRLKVLNSLLTLLKEEREALDKAVGTPAEGGASGGA